MVGETRAHNLNDNHCQIQSEKYKRRPKAENPQKEWNDQPTKCFTRSMVIGHTRRHHKNDRERKAKTDKQQKVQNA